jgi:capsular polysaccharide biosynthesis protein
VLYVRAPLTYESQTKYITRQGVTALPAEGSLFVYQGYAYWLGSEFLVDDYTQIVGSDAFALSVLAEMQKQGASGLVGGATADQLKGMMQADRKQRELKVLVTAGSREAAVAMSKAVASVLVNGRLKPVSGATVDDKALFSQIDDASIDDVHSSRPREIINAAIRVLIGLAAALALAFLLEYLDTSVRDEHDVERLLDVPVLGAIPK